MTQATQILLSQIKAIQNKFPQWTKEQQLKGRTLPVPKYSISLLTFEVRRQDWAEGRGRFLLPLQVRGIPSPQGSGGAYPLASAHLKSPNNCASPAGAHSCMYPPPAPIWGGKTVEQADRGKQMPPGEEERHLLPFTYQEQSTQPPSSTPHSDK